MAWEISCADVLTLFEKERVHTPLLKTREPGSAEGRRECATGCHREHRREIGMPEARPHSAESIARRQSLAELIRQARQVMRCAYRQGRTFTVHIEPETVARVRSTVRRVTTGRNRDRWTQLFCRFLAATTTHRYAWSSNLFSAHYMPQPGKQRRRL